MHNLNDSHSILPENEPPKKHQCDWNVHRIYVSMQVHGFLTKMPIQTAPVMCLEMNIIPKTKPNPAKHILRGTPGWYFVPHIGCFGGFDGVIHILHRFLTTMGTKILMSKAWMHKKYCINFSHFPNSKNGSMLLMSAFPWLYCFLEVYV